MLVRDTTRCDLAIVGGGILGAWCFHLATSRFPEWRTLLIERSTVGSGATAHSAGVWVAIGRTPSERSLAAGSAALYAQARAQLGIEMPPTSSYWVSSPDTFEPAGLSILDPGGPRSPIASERLASLFDFPLRVPAAELIQGGGSPASCDPGGIARTLVGRGRRNERASCWEGSSVTGVAPGPGGADIALADGTRVRAARTIVAVGPWILGGLVPQSLTAGLRIKRVVALHVDRRPQPGAPALFFPDADAYLMPLHARHQWLFSFNRRSWVSGPDGVAPHVDAADLGEASAVLARYLPDLAPDCRGGRAFCDAYAADGEPLLACHPDSGRIVVAGAGAGKGFRLAPGLAEAALGRLVGA